jgi:hypothetical protein
MLLRFVLSLEVSVKETLKSLAVTSFVAVDSCEPGIPEKEHR